MAEDNHVLRGINWRETFPFTNIFRSFRIAIHPSKLILALLALLLLYVGGRCLDGLWSARSRGVPDEIHLYERARATSPLTGEPIDAAHDVQAELRENAKLGEDFGQLRADRRKAIEDDYAAKLQQHGIEKDPKVAADAAAHADDLGKVKDKLIATKDQAIKDLDAARGPQKMDDKTYLASRRQIFAEMQSAWDEAQQIKGRGLWDMFMDYEIQQVNGVVSGVMTNTWMGNMTGGGQGVFDSTYRFFCVGPRWAFGQHWAYFILLGIWFLIIWAIFGGAIARIAAVHVAREEKISIRQALKFSTSKFLSFVFAPVIPLFIIVVIGLIVAAGGLLLYLPFVGPIVVGAFFFLALAAGFVMTLVALGTGGGLNLMYPTVAVEGSDSFDAISRSFSYVYARPWRMLWYSVLAIAYGAITYIFVRLFIFLTLKFTQAFVGLWIANHATDGQYVWAAMYPGSQLWRLPYDINFFSLSAGQSTGALLVSVWIYIVITFLGAYVVSFYFSANTVIYYLMRREVDATELDDVYLEQADDEFAEPATATVTTTTTVVTTETPAPQTPPASGDAGAAPTT